MQVQAEARRGSEVQCKRVIQAQKLRDMAKALGLGPRAWGRRPGPRTKQMAHGSNGPATRATTRATGPRRRMARGPVGPGAQGAQRAKGTRAEALRQGAA
eukprot:4759936-Alexandrium_andersonii.AAC.1